jgi:hypothetical protein
VLAQLRGVLAAVQSAEVAEEDDYDRPFCPERADLTHGAGRVAKFQAA